MSNAAKTLTKAQQKILKILMIGPGQMSSAKVRAPGHARIHTTSTEHLFGMDLISRDDDAGYNCYIITDAGRLAIKS